MLTAQFKQGQSVFDMVLQTQGTLEGLLGFILDNDLSLSAMPVPGKVVAVRQALDRKTVYVIKIKTVISQ
jgi:hypothetical protein